MPPPPQSAASSPSSRSQLRVRNVSAGVVYHLVFDGSLDYLSGAQLRTHLQGISQVAPEDMELFVTASEAPIAGPNAENASQTQMLSFTNTTQGAQVGLRDGMTVFMRVHPAPSHTENSEAAGSGHSARHRSRTTARTNSQDTPHTLSRLAPPTPPPQQTSSETGASTTKAHQGHVRRPQCPIESGPPTPTPAADAASKGSALPTPRTPPPPPPRQQQQEGARLEQDEAMRTPYSGVPTRRRPDSRPAPRESEPLASSAHARGPTGRRSASHTRVVVAPPWDDALPVAHPSPTAGTTHKKKPSHDHTPPGQRAEAARQHPPASRTVSAQPLNANDLEELYAEQEYVWRMERHRFNTERENRLRVIEERQRQLTFDATRLRREELLWTAKTSFEASRLQTLQTALEDEVETMTSRLALRIREAEEASTHGRLAWHSPGSATTGVTPHSQQQRHPHGQSNTGSNRQGLFDGDASDDDDVSVDVEVEA